MVNLLTYLLTLSESREPANKKAVQQRHFVSTKKKPKKRKAAATLSKPDDKERAFLLDSLTGNVMTVFTTAVGTDRTYDVGTSERIAFEHIY